jgi:hypothetical protein
MTDGKINFVISATDWCIFLLKFCAVNIMRSPSMATLQPELSDCMTVAMAWKGFGDTFQKYIR